MNATDHHDLRMRCASGHEQSLHFGAGMSREYVDMMGALMCGGRLTMLDRDVPGYPCGICGDKVAYVVVAYAAATDGPIEVAYCDGCPTCRVVATAPDGGFGCHVVPDTSNLETKS